MIKLNLDVDTLTEKMEADEERPAVPIESIPPDCNPEQYLDWRFRYAYHLVTESNDEPAKHEDAWLGHAVDFLKLCQDGNGSREPTDVDFAINGAHDIQMSDTLVRQVLEGRLLAQQSPREIANKCNLDQLTIEAYGAVFFDVRGHRRTQVWFRTNHLARPPSKARVWQLGSIIKGSILLQGHQGIEDRIDVILGLDGSNLADGLPERTSPEFAKTFHIRQEFAGPLLPRSRTASRLYDQFRQAAAADLTAGHSSAEAVSAGLEVLRRAKITVALRKQLTQLRKHCNAGEAVESAAETTRTAQ
jgi:hypothetical protein